MKSESDENKSENSTQRLVGLLYDEKMCKHYDPDDDHHPETPNRIRAIWDKLQTTGITDRCVILDAKEAEDKHLLAVHSKNHVNQIKNISYESFNPSLYAASKLNSIYFNEGSTKAAYLAAGGAIEAAKRVASKELHSAVAIVRPPGHHCEQDKAMGFCLFNNVAVAASYLLDNSPEFGVKKILIVDWDVHHGNGTQKMFWNDSRVLYFSVHRHEFGRFYPGGDNGFYNMIGEGDGAGYNINVPWENGRCGDADYLAVWDHILLPVAKEFNPDIIIVSAGFDAALGDPLGGCCITQFGYSLLLKKLMNFAEGRIVLVLEGGYNLDSISKSMHACVEVLLEDKPLMGSSEACPFESTWRVIQAVREELSPFWPTLACELPQIINGLVAPPQHTLLSSSNSETKNDKALSELLDDVIKPLLVRIPDPRYPRKSCRMIMNPRFVDTSLVLRGRDAAHCHEIFDAMSSRDALQALQQSGAVPPAPYGVDDVLVAEEAVIEPAVVLTPEEAGSSHGYARDSLLLLMETEPPKVLQGKDSKKGFSVKGSHKDPLWDFGTCLKSSSGGPTRKDGGPKRSAPHNDGKDLIDDRDRSKRSRTEEKDVGMGAPGTNPPIATPASASQLMPEPFFRLSDTYTDPLPGSKEDFMRALTLWDQGFLSRMDLPSQRRLITDCAISAYKVASLCTMLAAGDSALGIVGERPEDGSPCALEELQKKLQELKAAHQESLRKLKRDAEKSLAKVNRKFEEASKQLERANARVAEAEKETREALSGQEKLRESLEAKMTDLNVDRNRLHKELVDEKSQVSVWKTAAEEATSKASSLEKDMFSHAEAHKVHFEDTASKISFLEEEIKSRDEVNRLISVDIETLYQTAKIPAGKEGVALKKALNAKIMAEKAAKAQKERADQAIILGIQGLDQSFEDALKQVEFFHSPLKVDRLRVRPDQKDHLPMMTENQRANPTVAQGI